MKHSCQFYKIFVVTILMLCFSKSSFAQLSILSANFTAYNVSPNSLYDLQISNTNPNDVLVNIESKLYNANNEMLMHIKTNNLTLKVGINPIFNLRPTLALTEYSSSKHAQYIKTSKTLPSGKFKFCSVVTLISGGEPQQDEYCDELESDNNNLLYLVSVADKEEVETRFPLLVWNHSEPFNLLAANEYYRMVVVEMNKDQSSDAAVTVNSPIFLKNFLTSHSIQYPSDAKSLEPGKNYAWQVQKMSNGAVIDKTEVWQFNVKVDNIKPSLKYVYLSENLDASSYTCEDGHVYFVFKERYSGGKLNIKLYNDKHILNNTFSLNNDLTVLATDSKNNGVNYYDLNLEGSSLNAGIYFLEVADGKGEVRKLKIQIIK